MARMTKKRSLKAGMPPGSLVYVGDRKAAHATVTVIEYGNETIREASLTDLTECFPCREADTVTWIDVDLVHQVELVARLGECFSLHPLLLEDILNTDQRPKMEEFGENLFIVVRALSCNGEHFALETEQISLVLGPNYLISFQEKDSGIFAKIRDQIRNGKGRIVRSGADYLAYTLLDTIVDNYFIVLERLGERIETLEDTLVTNAAPSTLQELHNLKRDLIFLRRSVWPLREVLSGLQREGTPLVSGATQLFLRDVYDHTIHAIDTLETFRDMLSGMLDIYLTSASNRLNEVMKVLTVIATIFIPLTFIVGVYGMNFRHMPELQWRWGYPLVLLFMVVVSGAMISYFKRKHWF